MKTLEEEYAEVVALKEKLLEDLEAADQKMAELMKQIKPVYDQPDVGWYSSMSCYEDETDWYDSSDY